ncbi:hypothetical protein E2C01_052972 [Portunus trituberculatus]|uniref:Uncharacterized protein n=1 Tax=Portunus trituberculatus TaxID=210409 RepID=A0A5B7GNV5_PORTR|nr:hypothetical protein [Portunus trituberculatus]
MPSTNQTSCSPTLPHPEQQKPTRPQR